jgi:hypothetical protein
MSTQRGLAVVQTQVRTIAPLPQSIKVQQDTTDKLSAINEKWHAKVVKAYQSFGVEGSAS